MAHSGAPDITVTAGDFTVAIIAASWHTEVMDGLIAGAERAAADAGAQTTLIRVPGSFELAVAAARVAKHFDAVVALGVVHNHVVAAHQRVDDAHHCGGYARSNSALQSFLDEFAGFSNLPLEPVYTGKLFYALFDLIEKGVISPGTEIVAIHSGGIHN